MTRRLIVGTLGLAVLCVAANTAFASQPSTTHTASQKHQTQTISLASETRDLSERRALHASRFQPRPATVPGSRVSRPKPVTHVTPKPKPVHHTAVVKPRVPTSAVQAYALKLVGSSTQFACVDSIFTRESHWNPLAHNHSSGAMGIPQRVGAPAGWTDPYVQVAWGIHYMTSRYGSPCGAWSFWRAHGWY